MKRKIVIKVSNQTKNYKVEKFNNTICCYFDDGSRLFSWSKFADSKSFDDALVLCKSHAGSGAIIIEIIDI